MITHIELFKQIEEHAREWLAFSYEAYGWDTREYGDEFNKGVGHVRCYFAEGGDHKSVRMGTYRCGVSIGFFSPPHFGDMTHDSFANLQKILDESRALLDAERKIAAERTEEQIKTERQRQIDKLRERLTELESVP